MFTGIIQEIGRVINATERGGNLLLSVHAAMSGRLKPGDSVSINGACQTVVSGDDTHFIVEAVRETLARTNLSQLRAGSYVNLEMPVGPDSLLHGHLVQGHIDCVARIVEIKRQEGSALWAFDFPPRDGKYLIEKGSVAVDGVSLTVVSVSSGLFQVSIIPHTIKNTIFHYRRAGDMVNLEFDIIAKYIEKLIGPGAGKLTKEYLEEHGF